MRILIVWELIPEETKFYIVDVNDNKIINKIKKSHGQIINCTEKDEFALWLSSYLEDRNPISCDKPIIMKNVDLLIHSGFTL